MIVTYQIKPYEADDFLKMFRNTFLEKEVKITIETISSETDSIAQETTRQQMLKALEAEKRGDFVHTMTIEELEAMVQ
jgi:hypothetical protein